MNEQVAIMDAPARQTPLIESLDSMPDQALRELIDQARGLLAARKSERRKQALAQIRRLAKEHGLTVAVKQPSRKRGRPPKADGLAA